MNQNTTTLEAYRLLHEGALALSRSEFAGMRIDVDYCIDTKRELTRKIHAIEQDFKKSKFFQDWKRIYGDKTKIESNHQLAELLYRIKKIEPVKFTSGGKGATDEESLIQLGLPEIDPLLLSRKLKKLRDTYIDSLLREQVDGFIHPFFNLHNVRTFRGSSDHPNFQNIPKRDEESMNIVRQAIYPRRGHLIAEVDYSGIEVRVSVCYHKDPVMRRYILDETTDMHRDMAIQIFKIKNYQESVSGYGTLRQAAKNGFVFPQFYGDWYKGCADYMARSWCKLPKSRWRSGMGIDIDGSTISDLLIAGGIKSYDQFEEHVKEVEDDFWNRRFRVYQRWKDEWWREYQEKGFFDLLTGFRCSGVMSRKEACNYPIQGSAFHALLWSLIKIDRIQREEDWQSRLVGQIHDAMVLDIHPSELEHVIRTIRKVTCEDLPKAWPWIIVPLDVKTEICDIDKPWNTKHAATI